jgi:serine/threonine protein kinase
LGSLPRRNRKYNTRQADVYSLGIILFILVTGSCPWTDPLLSDKDYRAFVYDNRYLFSTWPITYPLFLIFCKVFAPCEKRMSLAELKEAVQGLDEFFPNKEELSHCSPSVRRIAKYLAGGSRYCSIHTSSGLDMYYPTFIQNQSSAANAEKNGSRLRSYGTSAEALIDPRNGIVDEHTSAPLSPTSRSSSAKESGGPTTPDVAPAIPRQVVTKSELELACSPSIPIMWLDHLPNELAQIVSGDVFSDIQLR